MHKILFLRSKNNENTTEVKKNNWTEKMFMLIEKLCPDYAATMVYESVYQHPNKPSICYHGRAYTAIKKNGEKAYRLDNSVLKEINLDDYTKNKQNIDLKNASPWVEWIIIKTGNNNFEYGYLIIAQLPDSQWNNNHHDDHISIYQSVLGCSQQIKYIREIIENYQKKTPHKRPRKLIPDPKNLFRTKSAQSQRKIKKQEKNRSQKPVKKNLYQTLLFKQFLKLGKKTYEIIIALKNYTSNLLQQIRQVEYISIARKYQMAALNIIMYIVIMIFMIFKRIMFNKNNLFRFSKKQPNEIFKRDQHRADAKKKFYKKPLPQEAKQDAHNLKTTCRPKLK